MRNFGKLAVVIAANVVFSGPTIAQTTTVNVQKSMGATCFCETRLGSAVYSLPGIDASGIANLYFSGILAQDNPSNRGACRQRCSDIAPPLSTSVRNAICAMTPDRSGVRVTMHARLGMRNLGERYPFGVLAKEKNCPAGWVGNSTNLPGPAPDGQCKKETNIVFPASPSIPNGTPFGTPGTYWDGFFWSNTVILRGNAANGGLAQTGNTCVWN